MSLKRTVATANALLLGTGLREQLNSGFLYVFAGAEPATADEALNMATVHTELVKISLNSTATGITFDNPAAGVLSKAAAETWAGLCTFSGYDSGVSPKTPTFYRFCAAGDDGRVVANASTGYRLQGTCGGPSSGADLQFGTATLTAANTQPVGAFSITID